MTPARLRLLVVGVGGQGVLTAARLLGEAAMQADIEVMVGQLHGMSQRGGAVECSVVIGSGKSSYIGTGGADVVMALEPLEALRALPMMSARTRVVVNLGKIVPYSLAIQGKDYPSIAGILASVEETASRPYTVDGPALTGHVGLPRALNVVMLGALAGLGLLPFGDEILWQTIEKKIPERFVAANRRAFELGRGATDGRQE
ncbi:MAG TPA: 2-oxoacid:acceptor oxidoreductase family protein [Myxococcota bacterium]|nr:2-oxoacid:acceptor oxidoreductase family protein [Myxococcota bacterium]